MSLRRRSTRAVGTVTFGLVGLLKVSLTAAGRMRSTAMSLPASVLLLTATVLLPVVTFTAAYAVSQKHNPDVWLRKGYFLSAAIDLPPASNFGSLGLTLTLAAFTGVVIVRHHVVSARLALLAAQQSVHEHTSLTALHRASLTTALSAAFGGHGVAAYQKGPLSQQHQLPVWPSTGTWVNKVRNIV